jgi:hypothetical protein
MGTPTWSRRGRRRLMRLFRSPRHPLLRGCSLTAKFAAGLRLPQAWLLHVFEPTRNPWCMPHTTGSYNFG